MRKTVVSASLLCCMQVAAQELGTVVRVFDVDLALPPSCVLHARPSIIDKDIRFFCSLGNKVAIHIYFDSSSVCTETLERRRASVIARTQFDNREQAILQSEASGIVAFHYLTWNGEVCVAAVGDDRAALNEVVAPIWR